MSKRSERKAAKVQARPSSPEGREVECQVNKRLSISRAFQLGLAAVGLAVGVTLGAGLATERKAPEIVREVGDLVPGELASTAGFVAYAAAGPVERRLARRNCERRILNFAEVRKQ